MLTHDKHIMKDTMETCKKRVNRFEQKVLDGDTVKEN